MRANSLRETYPCTYSGIYHHLKADAFDTTIHRRYIALVRFFPLKIKTNKEKLGLKLKM
jgi:hypothetical protein